MDRQLPSLSALRSFEAAARHESFKRAAEELRITPTAVSHQVKLLEQALGQALFTRRVRQVRLTEAGQGLASSCHEAFDALAAAVERTRNRTTRATVTLGLGPMVASKWLAPRLARFWQDCPGIDLRLHHSPLSFDIRQTDLDLAIVWSDGSLAGAKAEPLLRIQVVPVASPGLLAGRPPPLPAEVLMQLPLLHQRDRDGWREWCLATDTILDDSAASVVIEDAHVVLQAAIDGQGVALGVLPMIEDDLAAGRLVKLDDRTVEPSRAYHLMVPGRTAPSAAVERVRHWLLEEAVRVGRAQGLSETK